MVDVANFCPSIDRYTAAQRETIETRDRRGGVLCHKGYSAHVVDSNDGAAAAAAGGGNNIGGYNNGG